MTLSTIVLVSGASTTAIAQTNSWLHPSSGNWHDAHWSAGVLPGTNQTILLTNAGSKTVRVGVDTVENYPDTLRIASLTVSAPSNSINTLLLDSAGTNVPFWQSVMRIDHRGALVVLASALQPRELHIKGGAVAHGASSEVSAYRLQIQENGAYHFTNGMLRITEEGLDRSSVFNQLGGTNSFLWSMSVNGTYNLSGGRLEIRSPGRPPNIWLGDFYTRALLTGGTFNQSGGIVDATVIFSGGGYMYYNLSGGLRTGGAMIMPWGGGLRACRIVQTGGTNVGEISLTPHITSDGDAYPSSYILSGGELRSTTVYLDAFSSFEQRGGMHFNESIALSQRYVCVRQQPGAYPRCATIFGRYSLHDGVLVSSTIQSGGQFVQTGGSLTVEHIGGSFSHVGGEITATNLTLSGWFQDIGGTINHHGCIALAGGGWSARPGARELGPLCVSAGSVSFPTNASVLRFADSSAMVWTSEAKLIVGNWKGSFSGGGVHQLRFGNDATALTAAQVGQIFFQDPTGLQVLYRARMLGDGEVVPIPAVIAEKRSAQVFLHWPLGFILQTSTNIIGPFADVPNALNASPLQFTDPARFFRIIPAQE